MIKKEIRVFTAATIVIVSLISTGCATIVSRDKHKNILFNSEPQGAKLCHNGEILGTTPVTIHVSKLKGRVVEFQKEGYQPKAVNLALDGSYKLDPWIWGNLGWILTGPGVFVFGPLGYLVDLGTDHVYYFDSPIGVTLSALSQPDPVSSLPQAVASGTDVSDKFKILDELKEKGTITSEEYTQKRTELLKSL